MGIGAREVLLLLRAKDQASRVLTDVGKSIGDLEGKNQQLGRTMTRVGSAIAGVGLGMAAVGAGGIALMVGAAKAAAEYEHAAAKTLTQVSQFPTNLKEIKQLGHDVGRAFGVAFEDIQPALYDIFSTLDARFIPSMKEAREFAMLMAKTAVAGNVDMQTATRVTVDIMNNFGIGVDGVKRILDVLFITVRQGKGEFDDLARKFSLNAQSAVRSGQSLEEFAGWMSFVSLKLPSMANTAAAVGRSFDLMSNPIFNKRLKEMGISVFDGEGKFRSFKDVIIDLAKAMANMTPEQKAEKLKELTKGAGGTIQAMRALSAALTDPQGLINAIENGAQSTGAMEKAFAIMSETTQVKVQELRNLWESFKIELGELRLPWVNAVIDGLKSIMMWFVNLSPSVKSVIAQVIIFGSVILTSVGFILAVGGAITVLLGSIMMLGASLGGAIAIVVGAIAAFAAFIGMLIGVSLNFEKIKDIAGEVFTRIKEWAEIVFPAVRDAALEAFARVREVFSNIFGELRDAVGNLRGLVRDAITATISVFVETWSRSKAGFKDMVQAIWDAVGTFRKTFGELWDFLKGLFGQVRDFIRDVVWKDISKFFDGLMENTKTFRAELIQAFDTVFGFITATITIIIDVVTSLFGVLVRFIMPVWRAMWDDMLQILKGVWTVIWTILSGTIQNIINIVRIFLAIINGDWSKAWQLMKDSLRLAWDTMYGIIRGIVQVIAGIVHGIGSAIIDIGGRIIEGLWSGMRKKWDALMAWLNNKLRNLPWIIKDFFGIKSPSKVFMTIGEQMMEGLAVGIRKGTDGVFNEMARLNRDFPGPRMQPLFLSPGAMTGGAAAGQRGHGINIENLNITGRFNSPQEIIAEVDWVMSKRGL